MDEYSKKMWENLNNLEKTEKLFGPGKNPFETPFGPTPQCLSTHQVMVFIEGGENDINIIQHLNHCKSCTRWVARMKKRCSK